MGRTGPARPWWPGATDGVHALVDAQDRGEHVLRDGHGVDARRVGEGDTRGPWPEAKQVLHAGGQRLVPAKVGCRGGAAGRRCATRATHPGPRAASNVAASGVEVLDPERVACGGTDPRPGGQPRRGTR